MPRWTSTQYFLVWEIFQAQPNTTTTTTTTITTTTTTTTIIIVFIIIITVIIIIIIITIVIIIIIINISSNKCLLGEKILFIYFWSCMNNKFCISLQLICPCVNTYFILINLFFFTCSKSSIVCSLSLDNKKW